VGGKLDPVAFSALTELMRWREQRVRQLNLPRKWVADDAVLVDLARVRPKDVEHLGAFRGLNKGELKHSGEHILKVLRQAEEDGGKKLPPRGPRQEQPSASELQVLDLLKCYVGILADQHKIAVRHLATTHQLLDLVRHSRVTDPQEWVNREILTLPSAELVGQEILDFLNGRRALSVEVPTPPRTRLGVRIVSPS
jgi:ribonuclease D